MNSRATVDWQLREFDGLGVHVLYELLALRQRVFCVEQDCVYLDCDGKDLRSLHLLGRDVEGRLVAYARLLAPGISFDEASIGRVATHPDVRRGGLGRRLMVEAISRARTAFGGSPIRIGAQRYLQHFYESLGFTVASAPYDEDGIPHVEMRLAG